MDNLLHRLNASCLTHFGKPEADYCPWCEIERLRAALQGLYDSYVVELHGERTCDCDPSVGINTCAPCEARAALSGKGEV